MSGAGEPLTSPVNRELSYARQQLAATREILAAMGRDLSDPGAVLDTVLQYAARLCGATAAQLFVRDHDMFRLSRVSERTPRDYRTYLLAHPIAANRESTVGRAAEDKRTIQIADVLDDSGYGRLDLPRLTGFRTLLSTPMIVQYEVIGVLSKGAPTLRPSTRANAGYWRSSPSRRRSCSVRSTCCGRSSCGASSSPTR